MTDATATTSHDDVTERRERKLWLSRLRLAGRHCLRIAGLVALLEAAMVTTCSAAPSSGPSSTHQGCGGDFSVPARLVLTGSNDASQLCIWNLLPTNNDGIMLDYQRADVGPCELDAHGTPTSYILVWTGTTMLGPYCGSDLPPNVVFIGKVAIIVKMKPRRMTSVVFEAIAQPPSLAAPPFCPIKAGLDAMRGCNPFNSYTNSTLSANASSFGTYQLPNNGPTMTSNHVDLNRIFDIQGRINSAVYWRFATQVEWAPFVIGPVDNSISVCALGITLVGPTNQWLVTRVTDSPTIDYAGIVNRNEPAEVCSADSVKTAGYKLYPCRQPLRGAWVVVQSYCVACALDLREVLIFASSSLTDLDLPEW